ncbi:MAG TPA: aldo/keto reductase [Edaphobacter sp.]|jgi:aryl-alcohol dehydrogenase-like predicted oxidoreductase
MQTRTLGHTNISVAPVIFGGNVFGWTLDAPASFPLLDAFIDRGFNCIDTADVYARWLPGNKGGESETILGDWFKRSGKRDKVVLATKVGMDMGDGRKGLRKRYLVEAAEASLRRLQTDRIDLYQSHQDDETIPVLETLEAFDQLIRQGKVRAIGVSNFSGQRLSDAIECALQQNLPVYQTLQPEYNLYSRQQYETDLAPVVEKYGLGVITYFSLASGFLTGKYKREEDTKGANRGSRVQRYFDDRGKRILRALNEMMKQTGAHQAAIALAWLLAQPTVTAPIASATSTKQLETLFAAVELTLSEAQMKLLNEASAY